MLNFTYHVILHAKTAYTFGCPAVKKSASSSPDRFPMLKNFRVLAWHCCCNEPTRQCLHGQADAPEEMRNSYIITWFKWNASQNLPKWCWKSAYHFRQDKVNFQLPLPLCTIWATGWCYLSN